MISGMKYIFYQDDVSILDIYWFKVVLDGVNRSIKHDDKRRFRCRVKASTHTLIRALLVLAVTESRTSSICEIVPQARISKKK